MAVLPLIVLDNAVIARPGGDVVIRDLSWTMREGETWAIVGPTASGKTTLAETILGRLRPVSGRYVGPLAEVVALVSFRDDGRLFSPARHYYQQRFNFIEPQDDLTLEAFLRRDGSGDVEAVTHRLGIDHLRDLSLIKLSSGQGRRARIAHALLGRPELLILDDPFLGLDVAGREDLAVMLGELVRSGLRLLLIARREELPGWVTNVLELPGLAIPSTDSDPEPQSPCAALGEPIIELKSVHVAYGDRRILRDVSWTVRTGERWALLGPNGSGKSTLLSLLCGDHPQAYANDIRLFGRQRGTGESIWEIKERIGFLSPELHVYFTEPLTAIETASTGFFDILVPRRTTATQDAVVRGLFDEFGLTSLSDRLFSRLSTGEQRLVLLVRALVKSPPLVILDEPFQGLDQGHAQHLRHWLDRRLRPEQTLIFVSHREEEIPRGVTRRLELHAGTVR